MSIENEPASSQELSGPVHEVEVSVEASDGEVVKVAVGGAALEGYETPPERVASNLFTQVRKPTGLPKLNVESPKITEVAPPENLTKGHFRSRGQDGSERIKEAA